MKHRGQAAEYRYCLARNLGRNPESGIRRTALFCMLNPSTADDKNDDPTIRRAISFAKRECYSHLRVVNLFAARATHPEELNLLADPVGPDNDRQIGNETLLADLIIVAWGDGVSSITGGKARAETVLTALTAKHNVYRLGNLTKAGNPRHPLRLPSSTPPVLHRSQLS